MKILIVHNKEINYYPPVKSLVDILLDLGHTVTIMCYDRYGYEKEKAKSSGCKIIELGRFKKAGKFTRLENVFLLKRKVRSKISDLMTEHDMIWTTTDCTISLLGKELYKYDNHIMQLMELVEDTSVSCYEIFYKLRLNNIFKVHLDRYAKHAKCVVVPEANRAQIIKAMWGLDKLPAVLPNKPYDINIKNPNEMVLKTVQSLKDSGKRIILYQGIFHKERKLDEFAKGVRLLGEDYALCIMGRDADERRRLCTQYPDIIYIPFIKPPYHLLITQASYIGILTYFPTADDLPRKLNVVYCAPNKIYEYAYSGLPMIGNNIPGLSQPFEKYNIGKCFEEFSSESIANAIREIADNYEIMKENCKLFYRDTDVKLIVDRIISS